MLPRIQAHLAVEGSSVRATFARGGDLTLHLAHLYHVHSDEVLGAGDTAQGISEKQNQHLLQFSRRRGHRKGQTSITQLSKLCA